jgi:hypothetical protein
MYKYDLTDHNFIQLEVVIAVANLSYNNRNDTYKLEENDYKIFEDFVKNLNRVKFSHCFQNIILYFFFLLLSYRLF